MALLTIAVLAMMASSASEPPIIVTATRQTRAALEDCLARRCPVRDDAIASIQHAQMQFADGDYPAARKTLRSSLARNRHATGQDPRALSALWHALARVTLHNGDVEEYRRAALRSGTILANAPSVSLPERQMGEVQIGDALAASGDRAGAVRRYRKLGSDARALGDVALAEAMELRAIYAGTGLYGRAAARKALQRQADDPNVSPQTRTVATALAAQLDGPAGAMARLADTPVQAADAPALLLWAPRDKLTAQREAVSRALAVNDPTLLRILTPRSSETKRYRWVDVGFWIRPDGRVDDARILRGSTEQSWARDVVKLVHDRRYAPFAAAPDAEGKYLIERVTLTYDHLIPGGSHVRRRSGLPSYQFEAVKAER